MTTPANAALLSTLIRTHEAQLLNDWVSYLKQRAIRIDAGAEQAMQRQCAQFLTLLADATRDGNVTDIEARSFEEMRQLLNEISTTRARQGSTPSETATFV
ncbi:MAG TPA: RsbRD N-terminal domain-containing protein, partial [Burkholderiaceae bacterium]